MITRLIIFLIRMKLGLKKYEKFQFVNQKSSMDVYFFDDFGLMKKEYVKRECHIRKSSVSLNWLLDDECKIKKVKPPVLPKCP